MKSESAGNRLAGALPVPSDRSARRILARLLPRGPRRRRRILVHRRYQLRTALLGVTGMAFLVALMGFVLHQVNARSARELLARAPFLGEGLAARDRTQIALLLGVGLLFVLGVFVYGILESRRTAGAMINLRRRMDELRAGRLQVHLVLRRHDHFPELAGSFNEMAASLRARTEGELATLGRLSAQVSDLLQEDARGNRQGARRMAESLRQSLEDARRRKAEILGP